MSKRYYWLKLKEEFFKSLAMKKLRGIAGGETYTIIYLKMQLLSLRNEGYMYFEGIENSFPEEIALALDENEENVKVTLSYLQKVGLLKQINDSEYLLTEVPCLIGKETDKAEIMRRKRAKCNEKIEKNGNNVTAQLPPVTFCYTEIEKEKEKDIDIDTDTEESSERGKKPHETIVSQVVDLFNEVCVSFPKVKKITDKRVKLIKTLLKNSNMAEITEVFHKAEESDFLKGRKSNWKASFDWIMNTNNFVKVLEGNYDNKGDFKATESKPSEWLDDELLKYAQDVDNRRKKQ